MTVPEPSNSYYKAIFDNSLCAVFIALPDGPILDANTAAIETFGFSPAELKKATLFELFNGNEKLI
ncbi:MAG: PAS domain S-box protein [Mucilaginibacter sp.]